MTMTNVLTEVLCEEKSITDQSKGSMEGHQDNNNNSNSFLMAKTKKVILLRTAVGYSDEPKCHKRDGICAQLY